MKILGVKSVFFDFMESKSWMDILGDFGVSLHQFDVAERGFSTRFEADLDMRMSKRNEISAYTVVNDYSEEDLSKVLYMYGELKNARAMARVIVDNRNQGPIKTSKQLVEILSRLLPKFKEHKVLAQVYQAIRIEVNQEMEVLKEFLMQTPEVLKKGGRLSLISYHSLEE